MMKVKKEAVREVMIARWRFLSGIALLAPLVLSSGGCWDHVPMNERTIVVGMGIDKIPGSDPILLTVQVADLGAQKVAGRGEEAGERGTGGTGSQAGNAVVVETTKGRSLYDAIHNFLRYSSRQLTFSHNRIVILGNELARSGVAGVLDDMTRDYQFRATNWIFVAEHTANEILKSHTDLGTVPAAEIGRMMENLEKNALVFPVNRNDFVLRLKSEGNTSVAPLIQIENRDPGTSPRMNIGKMAVFKKDRLIDVLSSDESQGLLWFAGMPKGSWVVVPGEPGKSQTGRFVEVVGGRVCIKPHRTEDGVAIEVTGMGNGTVRETDGIPDNLEEIAQMERNVERMLKEQAERTIRHAQQTGADYLGYARIIHGDYPDFWRVVGKSWEKEFPRIKSRVHFDIKIVRFGQIRDSLLEPRK